VQVDSIKTRVESAYGVCNQRLKLKYDKLLSSFAFKFNLRHYILAGVVAGTGPTGRERPVMTTIAGGGGGPTGRTGCGYYIDINSNSSSSSSRSRNRNRNRNSSNNSRARDADMVGRCRLTVSKPVLNVESVYGFTIQH
jgi:hypothetical protein